MARILSTLVALALAGTTVLAQAKDRREGGYQLLEKADGDVLIMLTHKVDKRALKGVLKALSNAKPNRVSIGLSNGVNDYKQLRSMIVKWTDGGRRRYFCKKWLSTEEVGAGTGPKFLEDFRKDYEGSLIVLDNGAFDKERFHPAIGEDSLLGIDENPILIGLTAPSGNWRLAKGQTYFNAWELSNYVISDGRDDSRC